MEIKKKIYLTLAVSALLVVLAFIFVILPLFNEIKGKSGKLAAQKEEFSALEAKIANLKEFEGLYSELQYLLKEIDKLFVNSGVPVEFIGFLERTAKECRLEIEILSALNTKTEKDFWPSITFQAATTGSFLDFIKFLEKIENSLYLLEVQRISVNKPSEDKDVVSEGVKSNFSVKVFVK